MSKDQQTLHLWVIISTPIVDREKYLPFLAEHLAYQQALEDDGLLFAAGPLASEGGERTGRGLIVLCAASAEQAREIAEKDPMHAHGLRRFTMESWLMSEGKVLKKPQSNV